MPRLHRRPGCPYRGGRGAPPGRPAHRSPSRGRAIPLGRGVGARCSSGIAGIQGGAGRPGGRSPISARVGGVANGSHGAAPWPAGTHPLIVTAPRISPRAPRPIGSAYRLAKSRGSIATHDDRDHSHPIRRSDRAEPPRVMRSVPPGHMGEQPRIDRPRGCGGVCRVRHGRDQAGRCDRYGAMGARGFDRAPQGRRMTERAWIGWGALAIAFLLGLLVGSMLTRGLG